MRFQGSALWIEWVGTVLLRADNYFVPPFAMKGEHETRILKSFELPPLAVDLYEQSGDLLVAIWDGDSATPEEPTLVLCPCHAREVAHALESAAKAAKRSSRSNAPRKSLFPSTP